MFKLNLKEHREPGQLLADRLPWAYLVAPGVVEQKDGLLQATVGFRGPDLESATPEELKRVSGLLNAILRRLGGDWSLFFEAQRRPAVSYQLGDGSHPTAQLIDQARRRHAMAQGALFESRYYATFVYQPLAAREQRAVGFLISSSAQRTQAERDQERRADTLRKFNEQLTLIVDQMRIVMPYVAPLDDDALLSYLHSTISTTHHPVRAPEVPMYLDAVLPDEALHIGLESLALGATQLRVITVNGYPGTTTPALLDELNGLGFEYRWVTRWLGLSKAQAVSDIKSKQKKWFGKRESLSSWVSQLLGGQASALQNSDALNKAQEMDGLLQNVEADHVTVGYHTTTLVLLHEDARVLEDRLREVERVLNGRGFATVRERPNQLEAWLGSLPGHVYANIRSHMIHSLNLAHLMPLSATWGGPEQDGHFGGAPLMYCRTQGSTPFRLNLAVGDVGHTMILGPTGSGKSTLLVSLALAWAKRADAQVVIFDKGRSSRAATLAMGGQFFELSLAKAQVAFQPLRRVHEPAEAAFIQGWIEALLVQQSLTLDATRRQRINDAISAVAGMRLEHRTLFAFQAQVQDNDIRKTLAPFVGDGPWAALFDGKQERLELADWVTFEMDRLMQTPAVVSPALSYLFHRLDERFDGRPTLLILDEAWVFLDSPQFSARLKQWLKELRKRRVYVVFATQSVADALESSIADALLEACMTKLLLPNPQANTPKARVHYERIGLNSRQIELLSMARPKRDYYLMQPKDRRLFDLGLGPLELALVAASGPADHQLMDEVLAQCDGAPGARFAMLYLQRRGLVDEANQLVRAHNQRGGMR